MAEAIAALAFAGNIVQFLEFGAKFAMKADQIAKAGSNSLSELKDLRHITHFLDPLLQQFNADGSSDQISTKSPSQLRLATLSKECSRVVEELRQTIDNVGFNDSGRRRDAMVTSFRLTWNHAKIEKLHQQIEKLRGQLAVELLNSIREHSSQSLKTQEAILQQLKADSRYSPPKPRDQEGTGLIDDLGDAPGSIMLQYIRSTIESDLVDEQMMKTEEDIHQLLFQQGDYVNDDNSVGGNRPRIEMGHSRREKIEARIISSLRYSQIDDRETSIVEAYRETFQWMFKDNPPDRKDTKFRQWLESSERLYWITGKAGSGKSTLMKYISNFDGPSGGSLQCKEHLKKWAGGSERLIVASFYFWASGSSIEASQEGLFRSLLFQILDKHPYLLPQVTPRIWEALSSFGLMKNIEKEKSLDQILLSAIRELVERRNKKICLFVDGLDEYQGDHEKLIATFRSCLLLPNVKICVSSRPWIVFEDNFQAAPSMMVQEFTYRDIKHFVTSRFNENDGFARLQMREPDYSRTLMTNIIDKASGVFLWIKLVVASLLAGLTNDDRVSDLQRRLNLLPPDLERLYDTILDSLDPFYFGHASQYFQLLEASDESPHALLFSFSDEESSDFALKLPIRAFTAAESTFRRDTVKRRINSRCKGLLEVGLGGRVQYLHRSVKEYIDGSGVRLRIDGAVEENFESHLQLCSANLAMIKTTEASNHVRIRYAGECLRMAAKVKLGVSKMIAILDDLNRTLIEVLDTDELKLFYNSRPLSSVDEYPGFEASLGTSFLATTVRFSVVDYVRVRAEANGMAADGGSGLDPAATYPMETMLDPKKSWFSRLMQKSQFSTPSESRKTNTRRDGTWPLLLDARACIPISVPMFQCLLELGADPNLIWHESGATPWTEVLKIISRRIVNARFEDTDMTREWEQWLPILALFMEHGAHRDDSVFAIAWVGATRGYAIPEVAAGNAHSSALELLKSSDYLAIALECVADGRAHLGLEYLKGHHDIAAFKRGKERSKPTNS